MFPNGDIIFTNEITEKHVEEQIQNIKLAPGIFQEYIEKITNYV
ncbi:hypothetical protein [Bacillus thuringiensis]|nr:hypothetical protein [Bacillus thuringiensis]